MASPSEESPVMKSKGESTLPPKIVEDEQVDSDSDDSDDSEYDSGEYSVCEYCEKKKLDGNYGSWHCDSELDHLAAEDAGKTEVPVYEDGELTYDGCFDDYVEDGQVDYEDYYECDCYDHEPRSNRRNDPAYEEYLTEQYYAQL